MKRALFAGLFLLLCSRTVAASPPWIGLRLAAGSFGGAKVVAVVPGSPGERAGVHAGDEVLTIDDHPVPTPQAVIDTVLRAGVGQKGRLRLVDPKGHTRTLTVDYQARPDPEVLQRGALLGKVAPDFVPSVQAGAKLPTLSGLHGQVVLIDFFATWCRPCVEALPHVQALHQKLKGKGLVVLGISNESPSIVAQAAQQFHLGYSVASDEDEEVGARYQVFALPTMVVIDRQGVVRAVAVNDTDAVDRAVAMALAAR